MTRSEIREAIKKVFFEEIEPDSLNAKKSRRLKLGGKNYKSFDGKQNFRSKHEALAYNIFDNEGVLDQIESEAYRFQKTCNKIPDFVWESKKIIIEIAGMTDSLSPGYWEKLETAKPCFEKQGYTVYIIDTRRSSLYYNHIKFYEHLCDLLGFTPKPEIKDNINLYIGDPIDFIKQSQEIIQYKKDNPKATAKEIAAKFNINIHTIKLIISKAKLTTLSQRQAKNQEIIQYKKDNPNATYPEIATKFNATIPTVGGVLFRAGLTTPLSQTQTKNQEIVQYKKDNPKATYKEIADKLNISLPSVGRVLAQAGLVTPLSQTQAKNQEIIQYKKDNPNATYPEIATKFNATTSAVSGVLSQAGLTTSLSQRQAKHQEIVQYKKDNPNATNQEIADKFNTTRQTIHSIMSQAGLTIPLAQTQARNQEIIQYKKDNPKATAKEIADKFDLPVPIVYNTLNRRKKSTPTNEQSLNNKTITRKELKEIIRKIKLKVENSKLNEIKSTPKNTGPTTPKQLATELVNQTQPYFEDSYKVVFTPVSKVNPKFVKYLKSLPVDNDSGRDQSGIATFDIIYKGTEYKLMFYLLEDPKWWYDEEHNDIHGEDMVVFELSHLDEIKATPKNTGLTTPKQLATDLVNQTQPNFEEDRYIVVSTPVSEVNPKFIKYLKSLPTDNDYPYQSGVATFNITYKGIEWKIMFYLVDADANYDIYDEDMVIFELS
jgi:DNA-binding CsgD family transcriptional regulator